MNKFININVNEPFPQYESVPKNLLFIQKTNYERQNKVIPQRSSTITSQRVRFVSTEDHFVRFAIQMKTGLISRVFFYALTTLTELGM